MFAGRIDAASHTLQDAGVLYLSTSLSLALGGVSGQADRTAVLGERVMPVRLMRITSAEVGKIFSNAGDGRMDWRVWRWHRGSQQRRVDTRLEQALPHVCCRRCCNSDEKGN